MVSWSGNLKELKGGRCPGIQLYLLFFKTSDCSPEQFGEETPVLNDSFTMLLLWDFMEDLGFHFSVVSFSFFSHPQMIFTPILPFHTFQCVEPKSHQNYSEWLRCPKVKYVLLVLLLVSSF